MRAHVSMVAPSAPRDARSKTPPGPEGSNGIDRRGCRGQPAGSSPFPTSRFRANSLLFIALARGDGPTNTGSAGSAWRDRKLRQGRKAATVSIDTGAEVSRRGHRLFGPAARSEEHTSELQSQM